MDPRSAYDQQLDQFRKEAPKIIADREARLTDEQHIHGEKPAVVDRNAGTPYTPVTGPPITDRAAGHLHSLQRGLTATITNGLAAQPIPDSIEKIADRLALLADALAELENATSTLKAAKGRVEQHLRTAMTDMQIQSFTASDGSTVTISTKLRASVNKEGRDIVTAALAGDEHYQNLVKQTFHQGSFEATARELHRAQLEENPAADPRDIIPPQIREYVNIYEQPIITLTRKKQS